MKNILFFALLAVFSCGSALKPAEFDILVGTWESKSADGTFVETWKKESDERYTGTGYFIAGSDTVFRELLRIEKIGTHWVYIAAVDHYAPVLFTLTINYDSPEKETRWSFENTEHDYPQKIVYKPNGDNKLYVTVEGTQEGETMKEEFNLVKK